MNKKIQELADKYGLKVLENDGALGLVWPTERGEAGDDIVRDFLDALLDVVDERFEEE